MSREKGNRAAAWVADYLRAWWPGAEKTPNGRPGADVLGTPGVAFEVKTGAVWRHEWLEQAAKYATADDVPVLVYLPPGLGEKHVMHAQAVVPLHVLMELLVEADYVLARSDQ